MTNIIKPKPFHEAYRFDIDGLRSLAVWAVVFFHAFPLKLPGGFIGVDIFFVISGYLISSILYKQLDQDAFSITDFYKRRIKRIFPALSIVLTCVLLIGVYELLPAELIQLGKHTLAGTGFFSNLALLSEASYFDKSAELKPLLHLWSLAIEEQFYIFWPIALWAIWKAKKNPAPWLISSTLVSFIVGCVLTFTNGTAAFYLPFCRFWELGMGGILGWYYLKYPNWHELISPYFKRTANDFRNIVNVTGLVFITISIFVFKSSFHFPGGWALIPVLGTIMLIAAGPNAWLNQNFFSHRYMVWFGGISYPLYLWHWPAFVYLRIIKFDLTGRDLILYKLAMILLSVLLAWGTFKFIEKPIRKMAISKSLITMFCLPMIILGVAGFKIYQSEGMVERYPKEIRPLIFAIDFKFFEYARFGICHYDNHVPGVAVVGNPACVEEKRPLVFLWGDSFASALYPGLKSLQNSRSFGIVQATSCGTPPVNGIDWETGCADAKRMNEWNKQAQNLIGKLKPEILIMHAWWNTYGDHEWMLKKMRSIIPQIKSKSPNTKIIILGSVPQWGGWDDGLPRSLYRYWKKNGKSDLPPLMMKYGLSENVVPEETGFLEEFKKLGVTYISIYNTLCNSKGCLTRVGPKPTDLTAIDLGHLSKAGSEYLIAHIADSILKPSEKD